MKLTLIALVLALPLAASAQRRLWSGYPSSYYRPPPVQTRPVPDYAKDGKWLILSTNIARLESRYSANLAALKRLNALNTPKPEEVKRMTELDTLATAQEQQLSLWRGERSDIETRYKLKEQQKKKP